MPEDAPRILIVRLSALGDTVHGLPVLYALRDTFPRAQLGWLVEDRHAAVVKQLAALDRVHVVPRGRWRREGGRLRGIAALRRELRAERYETAIDLQGLSKSAFWAWLSGARTRIGFAGPDSRELNGWLATRRVRPPEAAVHVVDRNLALARAAGAGDVPVRSDIVPDAEAARTVEAWWNRIGLGPRVVGLSPGAGWPTKQWPPAHFGRLADRIVRETGAQALVLWGPGEQELAGEVWRSTEEDVAVAPPTTVPELIEALRRCTAFVAGDTGPLHVASALGVPCIALFGASDPRRNGPYGARHIVVTSPEVTCRPCWKTRCPTQIECLADLLPETVWEQTAKAGFWAGLVPAPGGCVAADDQGRGPLGIRPERHGPTGWKGPTEGFA